MRRLKAIQIVRVANMAAHRSSTFVVVVFAGRWQISVVLQQLQPTRWLIWVCRYSGPAVCFWTSLFLLLWQRCHCSTVERGWTERNCWGRKNRWPGALRFWREAPRLPPPLAPSPQLSQIKCACGCMLMWFSWHITLSKIEVGPFHFLLRGHCAD